MKIYTEEDLKLAHRVGAMFAYGRKSATKSDREKHFNEWFKENFGEEARDNLQEAYRCGEQGKTYFKKDGTVILPSTYEGIDG